MPLPTLQEVSYGRIPQVVDISVPSGRRVWNPVVSLTYDGSGRLTRITETEGAYSQYADLTWSGDQLVGVSAWTTT